MNKLFYIALVAVASVAVYFYLASCAVKTVPVSLLPSRHVVIIDNVPLKINPGDTIMVIKIVRYNETREAEETWKYVRVDSETTRHIQRAAMNEFPRPETSYYKAVVF